MEAQFIDARLYLVYFDNYDDLKWFKYYLDPFKLDAVLTYLMR